MDLQQYIGYFAAFLFVLALIALFAWVLKLFLREGNSFGLFPNKRIPRVRIVEAAGVDGRRRLLLVRRDNVEHLILIGGPNDLVVETAINAEKPLQQEEQNGI